MILIATDKCLLLILIAAQEGATVIDLVVKLLTGNAHTGNAHTGNAHRDRHIIFICMPSLKTFRSRTVALS